MILVNCTKDTMNILVGTKYLTLGPNEHSINTMLGDKDILSIVNNYTPEEIKLKITIDKIERNQIADLGVDAAFMYVDPEIKEEIK